MLKALTVRQPWASAIFLPRRRKDIENRTWRPVSLVGQRIAIHAAIRRVQPAAVIGVERLADIKLDVDTLPRGAIIGVVTVTAIVEESSSPWFEGPYGLVLAEPRALETPIPAAGRLGPWPVSVDVEQVIARLGVSR